MCLLRQPAARALDKRPTRVTYLPITPGPAVARPEIRTPHLYARSLSDREQYPPSICSPFWVSWPTVQGARDRPFCIAAALCVAHALHAYTGVVIAGNVPGRDNDEMHAMRRGLAALAVAAGLLGAACSGGQPRPAAPTTEAPAPPAAAGSGAPSPGAGTPSAAFRAARVRLVQVASLQQPVAMAARPGERALYVAEQTGRVRAIRNGQIDPAPVLDVSSQIVAGGEQGLLGLAFSPDGRFLYVDFHDRNA